MAFSGEQRDLTDSERRLSGLLGAPELDLAQAIVGSVGVSVPSGTERRAVEVYGWRDLWGGALDGVRG